MQLNGKHVLVTGGAKRIGQAIAVDLARDSVKLSLHYHQSKKEALALEKTLRTSGSDCVRITADLRRVKSIQKAVATSEQTNGPIDILINSASVFFPTPSETCSEEEWEELMDTNLKGQFFFAQAVSQSMLKHKGGVIINIADVHGSKGLARYAPYAASKGGLLTLTKSLAKEWAPKIRVNSISPGPVLLPENYTPQQKENSIKKTLLKRLGHPNDIAAAVRFMIENDYLTGMDLAVDGGRSL